MQEKTESISKPCMENAIKIPCRAPNVYTGDFYERLWAAQPKIH